MSITSWIVKRKTKEIIEGVILAILELLDKYIRKSKFYCRESRSNLPADSSTTVEPKPFEGGVKAPRKKTKGVPYKIGY